MGRPTVEATSRAHNRNNVEQLGRFLNERHPRRFMIWNLSSDDPPQDLFKAIR
jgi:hypothetical protein